MPEKERKKRCNSLSNERCDAILWSGAKQFKFFGAVTFKRDKRRRKTLFSFESGTRPTLRFDQSMKTISPPRRLYRWRGDSTIISTSKIYILVRRSESSFILAVRNYGVSVVLNRVGEPKEGLVSRARIDIRTRGGKFNWIENLRRSSFSGCVRSFCSTANFDITLSLECGIERRWSTLDSISTNEKFPPFIGVIAQLIFLLRRSFSSAFPLYSRNRTRKFFLPRMNAVFIFSQLRLKILFTIIN